MTFANVSNAVQRYPLSPPLSSGKNEDADRAKMHQQQSEDLTIQHSTFVLSPQQGHSQKDGITYGDRSAWNGGRKAADFKGAEGRSAREAYGYDFEYRPKHTAYYGYHGGWADWQQKQQEWDSSYPPPRPQPRPGQHTCENSDQQHPAKPPPESFTASHCSHGYACPQTQHLTVALFQQNYPLTQNLFSPAPRQNNSRLTVDDAEDYIDFNAGNSEAYAAPTTRSKTSTVTKAPPKFADAHLPGAVIIAGKTVRFSSGKHANLMGVVKSTTKNGANVELHSDNKLLMNVSKKQLEVIDTSIGATTNPRAKSSRAALTNETALPARGVYTSVVGRQGHQTAAQDMAGLPHPVSRAPRFVAAPTTHALPVRPSKTASPIRSFPAYFPRPAAGALSPKLAVRSSPSRPSGEPKVFSIARPDPHHLYMAAAHQPPLLSSLSCPLLVILDLNGTLLYRKNKGANFKPRPHLDAFLGYLFSNHVVMVWSSAKPYNVISMCQKFFTPEQFHRVAAIWTRDNLRLSPKAYQENTQVYKQLSWVWSDPNIQSKNPLLRGHWDQSNTVLLDDSVEKSASEPYNLVRIEEFEDRPDQADEDVLPQVALYLDVLRSQKDVSAYIRSMPFVPDREMPRAAAEAIAVAQHAATRRS